MTLLTDLNEKGPSIAERAFQIRGAQRRTKRQGSRFAQPQVARRVTAMDGRDESNPGSMALLTDSNEKGPSIAERAFQIRGAQRRNRTTDTGIFKPRV